MNHRRETVLPRFAANISFLFTELAFLDRFAAASAAGFEAVECLFPYDTPAERIAEELARHGLTLALFNLPPGDWTAGERGLAALRDRRDEFRTGLAGARTYAEMTGARRLHLLAGIADPNVPAAEAAYRDAVREAAGVFAPHGIDVLIEPINQRDIPGYFLRDFRQAAALIEGLRLPNVKLQFDIYHRQILHGDVTVALRELMPFIGHVQVAGVPGRNEPDSGELDCHFLFAELDRLGYTGYVGCEYRPRASTHDGLGWFTRYRRR